VKEKYIRDIIVYENYFWDFYNAQNEQVQLKIDWTIGLLRSLQIVPVKFLKHLEGTDGLYEMRIRVNNNIFRVFCFFDGESLVILFNGFQKKTEKIPKREIEKAEKLKKEYEKRRRK
jgi:phage-related protein